MDTRHARLIRIGTAIESICERLPSSWEVQITLERHSGDIELIDDAGKCLDFPTNYESLEEQLDDALEFALRSAADTND